MRSLNVFSALIAAALLVLSFGPTLASAHERRTIANGKYDVVVGWDVEPVYVGLKNAAGIRIMQAGTSTPVTGAEKTLKLSIRQGASTQAFPLKPVFGQDGYYTADIVPTRVGDYQWMFTGDVNGDAVNETFDTADGKFDGVQPATAVQFPVELPDPGQTAAAVQSVQAAQSEAQGARTMAMIGIAVGVLGLLAAVALWLTRPGAPRTEATARAASERV